jgi:hypothetical protein
MQSLRQRLVICQDVEVAPIKQVPKMADSQIGCQEFPIESRVLQLCRVQLLTEEGKGPPGLALPLLQNCPYVGVGSVHGQANFSLWIRVGEDSGLAQGSLDAGERVHHGWCPAQLSGLATFQYFRQWQQNLSSRRNESSIKIH